MCKYLDHLLREYDDLLRQTRRIDCNKSMKEKEKNEYIFNNT